MSNQQIFIVIFSPIGKARTKAVAQFFYTGTTDKATVVGIENESGE